MGRESANSARTCAWWHGVTSMMCIRDKGIPCSADGRSQGMTCTREGRADKTRYVGEAVCVNAGYCVDGRKFLPVTDRQRCELVDAFQSPIEKVIHEYGS
nr:hypothetical protein CFP56_00283 [Quercus suber]